MPLSIFNFRTRTEGNQPPNLPVIIGRNDANASAIVLPTTSASPLAGISKQFHY